MTAGQRDIATHATGGTTTGDPSENVAMHASDDVAARADEDDVTRAVSRWLLLDPADPACNDARDTVETLGRDVQHEAGRVAASLRTSWADVDDHRAEGGEIARSLADLRRALESLDPSELDRDRGWFARAIGKVPGVGSPADRYLRRLESSRARIGSIVQSLEEGRGVLSRDNSTLRADQERLHELSASLGRAVADVQAFDDALVFAIDVELAPDDPRRPLFEDDLLDTCRRRMRDLDQARLVNDQAADAIESVMRSNREMIAGIDRTCQLTLGALAVASTAAGAAGRSGDSAAFDRIDAATAELMAATGIRLRTDDRPRARSSGDTTIELDALRAAFDEIDVELNEIDGRRREALPSVERTVPEVTP
ncbi:MAG: toxic anion resistance protein [Ilumatobacter sp.]|uniref:toxic anion resistance protein n=1 Tax=Ilumatobacter sp. TaxID=1967498 RepID=UPI003296E548